MAIVRKERRLNKLYDKLKPDREFGYCIDLNSNRNYSEGHKLGFDRNDTEVSALQKILNAYIDTTSIKNLSKFPGYKIDFALSIFDTIYLVTKEKLDAANIQFTELNKELTDIAHRMTKTFLGEQYFSNEEKIKIFNDQQELLNQRRLLKDTICVLRVIMEHIEKIRNFILGMNRRQYRPKSQRYKNNDDFILKAKTSDSQYEPTMVYIEPAKKRSN